MPSLPGGRNCGIRMYSSILGSLVFGTLVAYSRVKPLIYTFQNYRSTEAPAILQCVRGFHFSGHSPRQKRHRTELTPGG